MLRRHLTRTLVGALAMSGALLVSAPAFAAPSSVSAVPAGLPAAGPSCVLLILFCTNPTPQPAPTTPAPTAPVPVAPPAPAPLPLPPVQPVTVPVPAKAPSLPVALHVDTAAANQLLGWVNAERASHGLVALVSDAALIGIANGHTLTMAQQNSLYHNSNLFTAATHALLSINLFGENVAYAGSLAADHANMLASPKHHQNIDDPSFRVAGFAVVTDHAGVVWVTEDFGTAPAHATGHPATATTVHRTPDKARVSTAPAARPAVRQAVRPAVVHPAVTKASPAPAPRPAGAGVVAQAPQRLVVPLVQDKPADITTTGTQANGRSTLAEPAASSGHGALPIAGAGLAAAFALGGLVAAGRLQRARRRIAAQGR